MMASALLSGAPQARRGAGHPRPDGKAEEERVVELRATTTPRPGGMRGPASGAAIIQGSPITPGSPSQDWFSFLPSQGHKTEPLGEGARRLREAR